jgi:hypothetical protein
MPLTHWSHLVGNVFQSILGSNQERVDIITKWLESYIEEVVAYNNYFNYSDIEIEYTLREKIEEYCRPYFRKE